MRFPAAPVFLRPGDALAFSPRIKLDYMSVRPVVHRFDEACAIRDLRRFPKKLEASNNEREMHGMREIHDSIPEVDTNNANDVIKRDLDRITEARGKECYQSIIEDPLHKGHTLLLVGHGASTRAVVKAANGAVMNGQVASYTVLRLEHDANKGPLKDTMGEWKCLTEGPGFCYDHLDGKNVDGVDQGDQDL